jgi:GR25 family glycosyltransferase involved in LPS biosynthesis
MPLKTCRTLSYYATLFCFCLLLVSTPLWVSRRKQWETLSEDNWMTGEESGFEMFGINRRDRWDRWLKFQKNVEKKIQHQIHRIEAVEVDSNSTGYLSHRTAVTIKRPFRGNHEDIANWNALSCYLTHRKVWQQVIKYQRYGIVFEDDAVIRRNHLVRYRFLAELEQVFAAIPSAVVFIGYLSTQSLEGFPWVPETKVSPHYLDITGNSVMGTHAYAISPQAAAFLLNVSLPVEVQIDAFLCNSAFLYPHQIRILARRKSKFRQAFHVSDIQSICFRCLFPYETPKYFLAIGIFVSLLITMFVYLLVPCTKRKAFFRYLWQYCPLCVKTRDK